MRTIEKLLILLLLAVGIIIPACAQKESTSTPPQQNAPAAGQHSPGTEQYVKTPSGLSYKELNVGNGASPAPGRLVIVHYTGTLENGTRFDSSRDRGEPFPFTIGVGQVIPGWDEGIMTMKVGGKRKLVIPPHLGYGTVASGVIPPNATLIFDVELIDVK